MKAKTLFRAYREAAGRRDWAAGTRRGYTDDVVVDCDPEAVTWRRYDRLAQKIWARLVGVLGECDVPPATQ